MSLQIHLDQGPNYVFTNLDTISGKVALRLPRDETFSQITVKLECEARTRLAAPPNPQERRQRYEQELEVHKLLYKTEVVFPSAHLQSLSVGQKAAYTLPYGLHEWPFNFRIPFNNACAPLNSIMDRMQMAQDYNRHIKRPLPPSLSGYPGMLEIRYYVKCTCQRTSLFKENFRTEQSFMFFPIEPVRSPPNQRESFARRQHQFSPSVSSKAAQGGMFKKQTSSNLQGGPTPPLITIEGRLPDPAIVTCNAPLPLRVLIKKLNDSNQTIFLNTIQLMLIAHTRVRAHDLSRVEQNSWVILSKANLRIPIGSADAAKGEEMEIDKSLWSSLPLPNAVCPSFETCNISRKYELKVSVGLMSGTRSDVRPELTVQELLMPCKVYSGIEPPAALVEEMFRRQQSQANDLPYSTPSQSNARPPPPQQPARPADPNAQLPLYTPPAPGAAIGGPAPANAAASGSDEPDDLPPSYEDAMAADVGPVDGPRARYEQPQTEPIVTDEKRGSMFGR